MTVWITRKNLHVDRTACPWLIRRFIDPKSRFLFVDPNGKRRPDGRTFDMVDAEFGHVGPKCTFEVMIDDFDLGRDPALVRLARIVHAADIDSEVDTDPFAPALLALAFGGLDVEADDQRLLERASFVYDALYAWCRQQVAAGAV